MPEVAINDILEKLCARPDGGRTLQFIQIFSAAVRNYLEYKAWVERQIERNGHYQGAGKDAILKDFCVYIRMIEDIAANGIRTPVREIQDKGRYELDGYHRLLIWKELGHTSIEVNR